MAVKVYYCSMAADGLHICFVSAWAWWYMVVHDTLSLGTVWYDYDYDDAYDDDVILLKENILSYTTPRYMDDQPY